MIELLKAENWLLLNVSNMFVEIYVSNTHPHVVNNYGAGTRVCREMVEIWIKMGIL